MESAPPEPKPKRSRRMVFWLVAVPIVILLLALAGANWKTFHTGLRQTPDGQQGL